MKATYRAALMAAALVFLIPLSALAGILEESIEVEPFIGYNSFEQRQNLKDQPVFGGRLGYNFSRHVGIEGVLEFINSSVADTAVTGALPGQFRGPVDGVNLNFYHIDAVYHFRPDGNFNPFVLAGFGGAGYSPSIESRDMAAFNVGVGAKYWVADHTAIRFDLRDYMVTEVFDRSYHNIAATIGITFAFGGKAKPEPAVEAKPEPAIPEPAVEAKPEPVVEATPEPKYAEMVVIIVSEPKAAEKVAVLAVAPKAEEKIVVLALEDLHFDFDKSELTEEAKVVLKRNFQILMNNPGVKVRVAGYTSARGTEEYNQKLSERRAHAVREYLIEEQVASPERLSEIGYGENNPAVIEAAPKNIYSDAAKANMRVLFEVTMK